MSLIIRPPWTQQPQQAVEIDPNNFFGAACLFASVGGAPPTFSGAVFPSVGAAGICQKAPATQQPGYAQWPLSIAIAAGKDYSIGVIAKPSTEIALIATHEIAGDQANALQIGATGAQATLDNNQSGLATYSGSIPELYMGCRIGNQVHVYVPSGASANAITGTRAQTLTAARAGRASGNNLVNTETYGIFVFARSWSVREYLELSRNPWQIFKPPPRRIWVAPSGGAVNGTGSGSLSQSNLSPVLGVGSSTSDATGIGSLDDISLQAILANASSSVTGSGLLSSLSLSSVSGSAQVSATAVSTLVSIILAAVSGSASTTGAGTATGALPLLSLSSLGALAAGSGNANASFDDLSLNAPQATAFTGAVGSGDLAGISLSSPSVIASGNALTTAALRAISLGVVNASATSGAPQILTQADIDAIVTALLTDPRLLTVAKFLALK